MYFDRGIVMLTKQYARDKAAITDATWRELFCCKEGMPQAMQERKHRANGDGEDAASGIAISYSFLSELSLLR
jgi:hypothetical protein